MMDCYENYTNCMNCMNNDIWYNIIKYSKIKEVSIIIGLSKSNQSLNNDYVWKNLLERDYEKSRYWINNNPKNLDLQHIYLEIFKKPEHCFDHCIQVQILSEGFKSKKFNDEISIDELDDFVPFIKKGQILDLSTYRSNNAFVFDEDRFRQIPTGSDVNPVLPMSIVHKYGIDFYKDQYLAPFYVLYYEYFEDNDATNEPLYQVILDNKRLLNRQEISYLMDTHFEGYLEDYGYKSDFTLDEIYG